MADILANNAFQQAANAYAAQGAGMPYTDILGTSLLDAMRAHVNANPTGGFYDFGGGTLTRNICDLSDRCLIAHCSCSYSGGSTQCTCPKQPNNVWRDGSVLAQAQSAPAVNTIRDEFVNSITGLDILFGLNNDQVRQDVIAGYYALQTEYTTASNATVLENWYGVGTPSGRASKLSETNYVKVCDSNWKYGHGPATCTWTVPAGATRAKFQVWGAGQGSNPACCCGGTPSGQTGAYAQLTIDVTAGEQYTLCAACSCSRYCCSSTAPGYGCMSGVTGPGICCLKADGGYCYNSNCDDLNHTRCMSGYAGSVCRRWQSPYCTDSGPCWCSLGEYCFDNSCATCGVVPMHQACCYTYYCSCACGDRNACEGAAQGHFGLHGGGCVDTNNYGYHIRPPVIDADTGAMFSDDTGCYCQTFTSGSCCGGCNGKDWDTHPGMGGSGTHVMGGANQHYGDTGRAGMIVVSWT